MKKSEIHEKLVDIRCDLSHDMTTYGELREMLNKHPEWDDLEIRIAESESVGERGTYIPRSLIWVHSNKIFNRTIDENHNGILLKVTKQWEAILHERLHKTRKLLLELGD